MEAERAGACLPLPYQATKSMCVLLLAAASMLSSSHTTTAAAHGAASATASPPPAALLIATADDQQALLAFKDLVTGDPHGVLTSWTAAGNTTAGVCSWRGVGCRSRRRRPGRVTSLELASANLTFTVSPFLANLTFLGTLNLSHNFLSGNIPRELGFLPRLSYLDLRHNSLQGVVPGSLAGASRLLVLQLEYNSLVGEIPANLSHLQRLEVLDVGSNQLSGAIPQSLGSLSRLTYLGLYLNNLSGSVPASLAYNHLSGTIPASLFNISSVATFELSGNKALSGVLPSDIGATLPNLQNLILNDCQLRGRIPRSIGNASLLRYIQLGDNQLEGALPLEVGSLKDLEVLTVESNRLEDEWWGSDDWDLIASLSNCSKLFYLSLDSNSFRGVLPPSIVNLSSTMQKLHLSHNGFHGAIPTDIRKLSSLTILTLRGNLLTGSIPPSIGELHSLGVLDLSENNISGGIPPALGNLTNLSILYLFKNSLQGPIPTSLGKLQNIGSLVLSLNQLTGSIPAEVVSLSSLTSYLGLSYNSLTGQIPSEVGKLTNLVLLDLSVNQLSGDVPAALGKCVELAQLQLNDNLLQGAIPQSLSGLQGMQELDVARNNLSGPVPKFFADWPSLNYLNLSYNRFEGSVPVTGVFGNASAFSVAGNNKVCGGVTALQLPPCPTVEDEEPDDADNRRPRRLAVIIGTVVGSTSLLLLAFCGLLLLVMRRRKRAPANLPLAEDQHWQVSFEEIQKATDQFSPSNLIGVGSFGSVYRGILLSPGARQVEVAIKVIDLRQHGAEHSFLAECRALRSVRHRNLVKVVTACSSVGHQGNDFKALVYEFMPNGDLDVWLHHHHRQDPQDGAPRRRRRLTVTQRVDIALDVAAALDYLHHHGQAPVVHCDLKPSNVLLDGDMVARVADFGLARFIRNKMVSESAGGSSTWSVGIKGTIGYIPPEYGMDGDVSIQGDLYSYGVLLLEMFTGKRPTDASFQGGRTLQSYVASCYPDKIICFDFGNVLRLSA
ncbi:LRR receptor-like serine/threonine-protein kinase EFR [Zea mays]|uniref:non-specific serine/threonine protein kinase n=1 Tax=Zea mays TaxID=4577 RepID=A0A1D6Q558_MAIZE|nr:LRR receptor-like serine/threonine-protein kinase EFR [Zea mays]